MAKGMPCVFCQCERKLSSEHIWGDWIKQYVPMTKNKHRVAIVAEPTPGNPEKAVIRIRAGDPINSQVGVVCEVCNTQWLSEIQERAKPHLIPLFRGEPSVLTIEAQASIATWIAMATMTGAYNVGDRSRMPIPQTDRDWLRHNQTAPDQWAIWIGHCERWQRDRQWVYVTLPIIDAESLPERRVGNFWPANTQTTAFKIGRLFAFSISSVVRDRATQWNWGTAPVARRLLQRIYPGGGASIHWPAGDMMRVDAKNFALAYKRLFEEIAIQDGYV